MKKLFCWLPALLFAFGLVSCAEEKDSIDTRETLEYSFELSFNDTKSIEDVGEDIDGTNLPCPDPDTFDPTGYEAYLEIDLFGDPLQKQSFKVDLIELNDGRILTDKIMIAKPMPGQDHVLAKLLVVSKADETKVIFASVGETSKFKNFVPADQRVPMDLVFGENLELFGKPCIPITVLCAVYSEAPDFGFAIWGLDFVKVVCFDYVVNIPEDPCAEGNTKDVVGTSDIVVIKKYSAEDKGKLVHEGSSGNGEVGTICFSDEGKIPNDEEYYTIYLYIPSKENPRLVLSADLTTEQLLDYECSGFWEVPIGADCGVFHFDLYQEDITSLGSITPKGEECEGKTPWDIKVVSPWECEPCYIEEPQTPFWDWQTFDLTQEPKDLCSWLYCGFTRSEKGLSALWGFLKTPTYCLEQGWCVQFKFDTRDDIKDDVSIRFFKVDGFEEEPNSIYPTIVEVPEGGQTWTFPIPEDGCYRIEISVVGGDCCQGDQDYNGITIEEMRYFMVD